MERVVGGWAARRVCRMRGSLMVATEPEAASRRCVLASVRELWRAVRAEGNGVVAILGLAVSIAVKCR